CEGRDRTEGRSKGGGVGEDRKGRGETCSNVEAHRNRTRDRAQAQGDPHAARARRLHRLIVPRVLHLVLVVGLASSWVGAAHAAPTHGPQRLVVVLAAQTAHAAPSRGSRAVGPVTKATPITATPTVLPVLGTAANGWVEVALPGRPNGHSGWIRSTATRIAETRWRLDVDLSERRVTVYDLGRAVRSFAAVVGKPG